MKEHCDENPTVVAKRFGINLGTAKRYMYGHRREKRNAKT
jgi:hypothetical protein